MNRNCNAKEWHSSAMRINIKNRNYVQLQSDTHSIVPSSKDPKTSHISKGKQIPYRNYQFGFFLCLLPTQFLINHVVKKKKNPLWILQFNLLTQKFSGKFKKIISCGILGFKKKKHKTNTRLNQHSGSWIHSA